MSNGLEQERADFEAWLRVKPCGAAHDFAWEAWKARAALQSQDRAIVMGAIQRLPRYTFGYVSDEWGMGRQLGAIRKDDGRFLMVDDVMEAIDHASRAEGGE